MWTKAILRMTAPTWREGTDSPRTVRDREVCERARDIETDRLGVREKTSQTNSRFVTWFPGHIRIKLD